MSEEDNRENNSSVGQALVMVLAWAGAGEAGSSFTGTSLLGALGSQLFEPGTGSPGGPGWRPSAPTVQNNPEGQRLYNAFVSASNQTGVPLDHIVKLASSYTQAAPLAGSDGMLGQIPDTINYMGTTDWGKKILQNNPRLNEFRDAVQEAIKDYPNAADRLQALRDGKLPKVADFANNPEINALVTAANARMRLDQEWGYIPEISGQFERAMRIVRGEQYLTYRFGSKKAEEILDKNKGGNTAPIFSDDFIKVHPDYAEFKGKSASDLVGWAQNEANPDLSRFYQSVSANLASDYPIGTTKAQKPEIDKAFRNVVTDYAKKYHPDWTQDQIERGIVNYRAYTYMTADSEGSFSWNARLGWRQNDPNNPNTTFDLTKGHPGAHAAGLLQYEPSTWRSVLNKHRDHFTDSSMSPRNQIWGNRFLLEGSVDRNGRNAMEYVLAGDARGAINITGGEWASFPSSTYGQHEWSMEQELNYFYRRGGLQPGQPMPAPKAPTPVAGTQATPATNFVFDSTNLEELLKQNSRPNMLGIPGPVPSGPSAYVSAATATIHQFDAEQYARTHKIFGDGNCKMAVRHALEAGYRGAGLPVPAKIADGTFQAGDLQRLGWTIVDYNKTAPQQGDVVNIHDGAHAHWQMCDKNGATIQEAHFSSDWSQDGDRFLPGPAYRDGNATVIALRPPPELLAPALPPVREAAYHPFAPGAPIHKPGDSFNVEVLGDSLSAQCVPALREAFQKRGYLNVNVISRGIPSSGLRPEDDLGLGGRINTALAGRNDIVFFAGHNDGFAANNPAYRAKVDEVFGRFEAAQAQGRNITIISPLYTEAGTHNLSPSLQRELKQVAGLYKEMAAKHHLKYVDANVIDPNAPAKGANLVGYSRLENTHGVHLDPAGYEKLADTKMVDGIVDQAAATPVSTGPIVSSAQPPAAPPPPKPAAPQAEAAPAPSVGTPKKKVASAELPPSIGRLAHDVLKTAASGYDALLASETGTRLAANDKRVAQRRHDKYNIDSHPETKVASADIKKHSTAGSHHTLAMGGKHKPPPGSALA